MKNIVAITRPAQHVKNLFIFLPLFFAGRLTQPDLLMNSFIAFVAFSISASAIYILNDFLDIKEDRQHPRKRYRPLASGSISKKVAIYLMCIFAGVGISLMAFLSFQALSVLSVYIILNIFYSFYLKRIAILDVTIIATGFVLRLFVGSIVTGISLSMWIVLMTFLLCLFLALAKRRDDIIIFSNTGKKVRKAINGYNLKFIDGAMTMMASVVIVAYTLYTTSKVVIQRMHSDYLYLTVLFVILGIMRYLQIVFVEEDSGSPTNILLKDKFIQIDILSWILSFVWIIYL
ncbi:MAG: decaprenyl-phosphate phosphoribosyltransferase [Pseudomonadota bacterium]